MNESSEKKRWVLLAEIPYWTTTKPEWIAIYEAPKDKFHCVMLATQQEVGLFVLKSLPRNK